ncbi:hypothetical protein KV112_19985 [Mycolicibacter sp. MYC123]|uniref:PE-PGRS family protein n=1 Tax=[Mycobacterium] zoologicum TaxID=2872311 RepID=A0ABU5YPJ5_9MYCO|nr:hypothetical protein [Mycolicibacter sp. MYC123]MEB3051993.1 hypothetical protein [Mycolicibacter sp. MYC123]
MSAQIGVSRGHALAVRSGSLAVATILASAGLFGVATVEPPVSGASFTSVQQDIELTALTPGSFMDALQNMLAEMNLGTLNQVLALLGMVPDTNPEVPFDVGSTVSELLKSFNGGGLTLGDIANSMGIPLADKLWTPTGESLLGSSTFLINGVTVDNPLVFTAPASFYTTIYPGDANHLYPSIDGTPLGNVGLGKLVDLLLGGAGEGDNHSVADLASQLGFNLNQDLPPLGPLGGVFSFFSGVHTYADAINKVGATLSDFNEIWRGQGAGGNYGPWVHDVLNANSSLNDWLSGLLGMPTTAVNETTYKVVSVLLVDPSAYVFTTSARPLGVGSDADTSNLAATTLGQYLQSVTWSSTVNGTTTTGPLSDQTLAGLLGLNPDQTWNEYLSNMLFGGTFFHAGTSDWGSQTLGELLSSWLPDGSPAVTGLTEVGDYLAALLGQ